MAQSNDDILRGALAYIDGAIELCPKNTWETRARTLAYPIRRIFEAGEIMMLLWVALLAIPGVGLAIVLQQSIIGGIALTLIALLCGRSLYTWSTFEQTDEARSYRELLREEIAQVERFFSEAQRVPQWGRYIGWEGEHPLNPNPRVTLRVLRNTRTKIEWLRRYV